MVLLLNDINNSSSVGSIWTVPGCDVYVNLKREICIMSRLRRLFHLWLNKFQVELLMTLWNGMSFDEPFVYKPSWNVSQSGRLLDFTRYQAVMVWSCTRITQLSCILFLKWNYLCSVCYSVCSLFWFGELALESLIFILW